MRTLAALIAILLLLSACATTKTTEPAPQNRQTSNDQPASMAANPTDLYNTYNDSVYFVKTECLYKYIYPDFFLRTSVSSQWGLFIDLTMIKDTKILNASDMSTQRTDWVVLNRTNSTKQYGTAFAIGDKLYTNNHVVECPSKQDDIIDYFDLIDLSGRDVNKLGSDIYDDQNTFKEVQVSKSIILNAVNGTVAEHFRSKANFTLLERKIMLYHRNTNFTDPILATALKNGSTFPDNDFAILRIDAKTHRVEAGIEPVVGTTVYALGFPMVINFEKPKEHNDMQTNPPVITQGIVSNRILSDHNVTYYVIDAAATFGSSGSPVFDDTGKVIGILTAGYGGINLIFPISQVPNG